MKQDFAGMMKQAQKMQAEMARVQEELAETTVEASVGGGVVKVVMSGDIAVREVRIEPSALDPAEAEMLQDMVAAAVNEAIRQAQELAGQKMARVTGGLNIPGLM
jgi:nucleoid-associated protein EbfC